MELRRLVCALGVAQIVSWGTLFYSIAVLGPPMALTLGVTDVVLYGSFTAGLFLSGIASPWIGIRIGSCNRVPSLQFGKPARR